MSDAKFAALLAFLGVLLTPFMALIVQRLGKIEKKVDGEATARREQIEKLHAVVTQKNAEIAQQDKVQMATEMALEAARTAPAEKE